MDGQDNNETTVVTVGDLPLTVARPAGEPIGGVIVVQEAFGVTEHIADVAARAATAGYLAIAPHLFHRSGDPVLAYGDMDSLRAEMDALTPDGLTADIDGSIAYLHEAGFPADRIGIVGFCMGGSVAFHTAATRSLGAAVTFYGGGVTAGRFGWPPLLELAGDLSTPWLGLYGAIDKSISIAEVDQLRSAVAHVPVPTEVVVYEGADHGFHCDGRPAVFHPQAAADAWSRTLDWFARNLNP